MKLEGQSWFLGLHVQQAHIHHADQGATLLQNRPNGVGETVNDLAGVHRKIHQEDIVQFALELKEVFEGFHIQIMIG
jgi:hypothetical protein